MKTKLFFLSLGIFSILTFYLYLRGGNINLFVLNKAIGDTAVLLLGITLFLGSLSRLYDAFDGWLRYRREVGLWVFYTASLHGILSLFFIPERFNLKYYLSHLSELFLGLISLFVLIILFVESYKRFKIKAKNWWKLQNWGVRIAGILAFLHLWLLKYPSWTNWFIKGENRGGIVPQLPPTGLWAGAFFVFIILARLSELLGQKVAKKLIPLELGLLVSFLLGSVIWGMTR